MKDDLLLLGWIASETLWDIFIVASLGYLVFWRGRSAWWFVLIILLCSHTSLMKALRKRFAVPEDDEA